MTCVIPYYRSNVEILEHFLIGREQSRHSFAVILSLGGATGQVSTVLIGREPSRDLRRHSSSFAYHVTSLWRLPSCFAAMLFCDDTVTRRQCYESNVSMVLIGRAF